MIQTWLTKTLGIQYPIIQGAFHRFGTSVLAGPVSSAGALGMLAAHCFSEPESLRNDIRSVRAMTQRPLAVNFTVRADNASTGPGKTCKDFLPWVDVALEEGVQAIITSAYDGSLIGKRVQKAGVPWIHKCASIKHALSASRKGVDALVIVGLEGTGYKNPNQNTTLVNIVTLRQLTTTPLIAAGGIGDGRGLAAALCMGACGVYLGTAFMATQECPISEKWKQAIVSQDITDSAYHQSILGLGGHDRGIHSMASGVINSIRTVADLVQSFMQESEQAIREISV